MKKYSKGIVFMNKSEKIFKYLYIIQYINKNTKSSYIYEQVCTRHTKHKHYIKTGTIIILK